MPRPIPPPVNSLQEMQGLYHARQAARQSNARRLKVGAAIYHDGAILTIGYNHMPDFSACEPDDLSYSYPQVIHAEEDALRHCIDAGLPIAEMALNLYVTHSPCIHCSIYLVQYKIAGVTYAEDYRDPAGIEFLKANCIPVYKSGA
jgi:dCMP deaminase